MKQAASESAKTRALECLEQGKSIRETARICGVSAPTVSRWKQAASESTASKGVTLQPTEHPENVTSTVTSEPSTMSAPTVGLAEHLEKIIAEKETQLAEKSTQIALLTTELSRWQTQTDKLTDALTDERRRNDVLLLQAAQRPALPSPDVTTTTSHRRELWVFIAAVAGLVLLAIALLTAKG